jgi:ABC-2 type transport system permease protein
MRVFQYGLLVGYRDFCDFWNLRTWFAGWMLRTLTTTCAWVLLGRLVGSEAQVRYLLVGNAIVVGASAALWASNATTWSRYDGTHVLLVASPRGLLPAILGRTSIWFFNGVASGSVSFAILTLAFGYRVPVARAFLLLIAFAVICASTFCFALFMGSLLVNRIRWRNMALDIVGTLLLALSGASVPVSFWPPSVQWVVQVLPVTHGLSAARLLLEGSPLQAFFRGLLVEFLVGGAWLAVSVTTIHHLFNAGRDDGSIEFV